MGLLKQLCAIRSWWLKYQPSSDEMVKQKRTMISTLDEYIGKVKADLRMQQEINEEHPVDEDELDCNFGDESSEGNGQYVEEEQGGPQDRHGEYIGEEMGEVV